MDRIPKDRLAQERLMEMNPQLVGDPDQLVSGHALICGYAGEGRRPVNLGGARHAARRMAIYHRAGG